MHLPRPTLSAPAVARVFCTTGHQINPNATLCTTRGRGKRRLYAEIVEVYFRFLRRRCRLSVQVNGFHGFFFLLLYPDVWGWNGLRSVAGKEESGLWGTLFIVLSFVDVLRLFYP